MLTAISTWATEYPTTKQNIRVSSKVSSTCMGMVTVVTNCIFEAIQRLSSIRWKALTTLIAQISDHITILLSKHLTQSTSTGPTSGVAKFKLGS